MKRSGLYAGPGPTGEFSDRTAAAARYLRHFGDRVAWVDLYQITLATLGSVDTPSGRLINSFTYPHGLVLRFASTDYDVPFEGVAYRGGGAGRGWRIDRKEIREQIGTAIAELTLNIALDGSDELPPADDNPATPRFGVAEAIAGGLFDAADVLLRRLLLPAHPERPFSPTSIADRGDLGPGDASLGAHVRFRGRITGESQVTRARVQLAVRSYTEMLQKNMPWRTFQPGCLQTLYDRGCGVSRTGSFNGLDFQYLGAIATWDQLTGVFTVTPAPAAAPAFALGTVQFRSGVLCGLPLQIATHVGSSLGVLNVPPRPPAIGDLVVMQVGCDKVGLVRDAFTGAITDGTCETKFGNLFGQPGKPGTGFSGMPHIPAPETAF